MKIFVSVVPELGLLVNFHPKELEDFGVLEKSEHEKTKNEQVKKRRNDRREQERDQHEKNGPVDLTQKHRNPNFTEQQRQTQEKGEPVLPRKQIKKRN